LLTRVLIAGGGIGGLALALALAHRGIACTICEAGFDAEKRGAGLNLLPHATAALETLGVVPELEQLGILTKTLTYMNRQGQEISSEERGRWAGHTSPQISIHRGVFHAVLLRAVKAQIGKDVVRFGHRLVHADQSKDGIVARFEVDEELVDIEADVIVGADGIHSAMRRQLVPDDGGIKWSGIIIWRGTVDWPVWRVGDHMLCAGDMQEKLIFYPIGPGSSAASRLTNWALCARLGPNAPVPPKEDWSRYANRDDVLARSRDFSIPELNVDALVQATPEIFEFPMADRNPLPSWTKGRMTLLGDAAHPMYPTGSNGAAQAILDAMSLARHITTQEGIETSLMAYEAERRPATEAIVLINREGGPERVVDLVSARAPNGFTRLEDIVHREELTAIGLDYARKTGFETNRS
jgi:5-methylphenazine-1-carboxylate 1-monooxygenase